jgi:hypothetical protein
MGQTRKTNLRRRLTVYPHPGGSTHPPPPSLLCPMRQDAPAFPNRWHQARGVSMRPLAKSCSSPIMPNPRAMRTPTEPSEDQARSGYVGAAPFGPPSCYWAQATKSRGHSDQASVTVLATPGRSASRQRGQVSSRSPEFDF